MALTAPDVAGLKVTVNGTLWPAGMVTGRDRPPTLNTELFVLAAVTVTLAPLAVRLPVAVPLVPSTTLPSPIVVGVTASCPFDTAIPEPDSGNVNVGFGASDVMVTVPLAFPVVCGAKVTVNVVLWVALSVNGAVIPLS